MKNNRIPRVFNCIVGKMLVETSASKPGDILHVFKNDSGYLALNTRTGKYAYIFVSMLRNKEVFELIEIL